MSLELKPNAARLKESLDRFECLAQRRASPIEGLTRREFDLLLVVGRAAWTGKPGLRQGEIVEAMDVTPPTVTPLIDRVEQNGLVDRRADPGDRRATVIVPTERGGVALRGAFTLLVDMFNNISDALGEDAVVLADLLDRVVAHMAEIRRRQIENGLYPVRIPAATERSPR